MKAVVVQGYPEAKSALIDVPKRSLGNHSLCLKMLYSSINYKDMLAVTGRGKIMRHFPLIAGIDVCGQVIASNSARFSRKEEVLVCGAGLGEQFDGGFAEEVMVPADAAIKLPDGWTAKEGMLLGTAGFSAALAIIRLREANIMPEMGEIVVTGATGGVGLWAVKMLSYLGYDVVAVSRKIEHEASLLYHMGAQRLMTLPELEIGYASLGKARFIGGIDQLGGRSLAALLAQTQIHGAVAVTGMAQSLDLNMTVMPFILRGVSLLGITSSNCQPEERKMVWKWLATHFDTDFLNTMPYTEVFLDEVIPTCMHWEKRFSGRVIIKGE